MTAANAAAAAYRAGSGAWQTPSDPTNFSFTVTGGGAYDVAVRCNDTVNLYGLTTDDLTSLDVGCEASSVSTISYTVNFDATGVSGAAEATLFRLGDDPIGATVPGNAGTFNVTDGIAGNQDLVILVRDGSDTTIAAKMVNVTLSGGESINVTIAATDAVTAGTTFPDFSANVPAGFTNVGWTAYGVTPKGTLVQALPDIPYFSLSATGGAFIEYGFADRTVFIVIVDNGSGGDTLGYFAGRTSGAPASVTFSDPVSYTASGAPTTFSGFTVPAGLAFMTFRIDWGTPQKNFNAVLTKAYLGSSTSYTMPDLTALTGFAGMLPASGDTVNTTLEAIETSWSLSDLFGMGPGSYANIAAGMEAWMASHEDSYTAP